MMGACVGNLSWDEVRNPEFELPIESVGAYNALKAFVIEKGIVTPTEA